MSRNEPENLLGSYSQAAYVARPERVAQQLMPWYEANRRVLPWRSRPTLYRVWISEVMLQQTQVATVIPYFQRFMVRFPNVKRLAEAPEDDVLRCWEGLGYYRRARQLHRAARQIVQENGGRLPRTQDGWLALPGIGRYTANAIVSIALDQRQPILEGNTRRLYTRLLGMRDDPATTGAQRTLWEFAERILPDKNCGSFNQALMELGATVCVVSSPECAHCPLRSGCPTRQNGWQTSIPAKPAKRLRYENLHEAIVVVRRRNKWLVHQRGPGERWSGLWDLPRFDLTRSRDHHDARSVLLDQIRAATGLDMKLNVAGDPIQHAVTRFRIQLDVFVATEIRGRTRRTHDDQRNWRWVSDRELDELALNVTARRVVRRFRDA